MTQARRRKSKRNARCGKPARAIEIALAGLAYDIRTPLTGILALSQLLQASELPRRERQWADAIRSAAEHLARLTALVVDAGTSRNRGAGTTGGAVLAGGARAGGCGDARRPRRGNGLDVEVSIAKNLPSRVTGDEVRLRNALENLIDIAVKFTERGRIALSVRSASSGRGKVRLTYAITDSGIGMTVVKLKRLFHPFARCV
jgi:two-component system, sensor histidine kinase